jgi:hypothetical protein
MLSAGLECFLQGWNAFVRVGIPLYMDEIHSTGVECILEGWNAFCRDGMLFAALECFLQCWNSFVQGWNAL